MCEKESGRESVARNQRLATKLQIRSFFGFRRIPSPDLLAGSSVSMHQACILNLTMISSVIAYRTCPRGRWGPLRSSPDGLGALFKFSIIMWSTGATEQWKILQVCDEEGLGQSPLSLSVLHRSDLTFYKRRSLTARIFF